MNFKLVKSLGKCRSGVLEDEFGNKFKTPICFSYTRGGQFPFISKDIIEESGFLPSVLQMPLNQFVHAQEALTRLDQGLSGFTNMTKVPIYCSTHDPAVELKRGYNESDCLSVWSKGGKHMFDADSYMNLVETLRPSMFEIPCDDDCKVPDKKIDKCSEKSFKYLTKCIERFQKSEKLKNAKMIAPLVGGLNERKRMEYVRRISSMDDIFGYSLVGFHSNGLDSLKVDLSAVKMYFDAALVNLPIDGLRILPGAFDPVRMIQAVRLGVDAFDSSYAYWACETRVALTLNLGRGQGEGDSNVMFITEPRYTHDHSPILSNCRCYTCENHVRSYVRHLLLARELLGSMLLSIHNHHHLCEFFKSMRGAMEMDRLDEFETSIKSKTTPSLDEHLDWDKSKQ